MATTIIGILRNRTFFTFESLNKAIYIEMNKLNNEEFQKREGSRKSVFLVFSLSVKPYNILEPDFSHNPKLF